jgi:hypothetical protein
MPVRDDDPEPYRPSRLETLGAWLHVWTPPRDAEVPPVPWRKVGIGAALALLVVAGATALIAPSIDDTKRSQRAEERRADERMRAERRARILREQQPRRGRLDAAAGSRAEAVFIVERAIGRDARARFDRRARRAVCEPLEQYVVEGSPRVPYRCVASTSAVIGAGDQEGARGEVGIPYRAILDFAKHRYAFCKLNPLPSERDLPDPRDVVKLPPECAVSAR